VIKRTLPVTARFSGKPSDGFKISETTVLPESVAVQGPADEVRRLASVETVPVDIEGVRSGFKRKVRLSTDGKPFSFFPDQVDIAVQMVEEELQREFGNVEVQAKDFNGVYSVNPQSVYLRLSGSKRVLENLRLGADQVYLSLKGLGVGEHSVSLAFNLPSGIKVVEQKPLRFRVRITKPAA
jgi:YbbR domain-containing protein